MADKRHAQRARPHPACGTYAHRQRFRRQVEESLPPRETLASLVMNGLRSINDAPIEEQERIAEAEALEMLSSPREGAAAVSAHLVPQAVRTDGVAEVLDVLDADAVKSLLCHVNAHLAEAQTAASEVGEQLLGAVLCRRARFDLKLNIDSPAVSDALQMALSRLGGALRGLLGERPELFELGALISDPGSPRQPLHPDTPWSKALSVVSVFVALQDVEADMGPTHLLPRTHTDRRRAQLWGNDPSDDDDAAEVLEDSVVRTPTPRSGDAVIFDARTIHCGGTNTSARRRVIFYFSFRAVGGGQSWRGGGFTQAGTLLDSLRGRYYLSASNTLAEVTTADKTRGTWKAPGARLAVCMARLHSLELPPSADLVSRCVTLRWGPVAKRGRGLSAIRGVPSLVLAIAAIPVLVAGLMLALVLVHGSWRGTANINIHRPLLSWFLMY